MKMIMVCTVPHSNNAGGMKTQVEQDRGLTFQPDLIPLQRINRFTEEFLRMRVTGNNTSNVYLFPFNWNIVALEDCLDGFGNLSTDTITYQQIKYER